VTVVLDASVLVKWLLADPKREQDTERATSLVQAVVSGECDILQPFHWLAEVGAVLVRLSPATASDDVLMLRTMELPSTDEVEVLRRACSLAIDTRQHLFDVLYHAVALGQPDSVLITADEQYYKQARAQGHIQLLSDWRSNRTAA
jgi:predicted nucleic acid-binding protein